jgi:hypothetical protein
VGNKVTGQYRGVGLSEPEIRENGFLESFLAAQQNLATNGNPNIGEETGIFGQIFQPFRGIPPFLNAFIAQGEAGLVAHIIDAILDPQFRLLETAGLPLTFFRLNPQFLGAGFLGNNSNSTWHGLKVEMTRRFHQGLQFQINYTLGKGLTDFSGTALQFAPPRDPQNLKLEKTFNAFDSRHVLNANFLWQLPVGRGQRWLNDTHPVVDGLLGGWQINGIGSYASGWPFTVSSGRKTLNWRIDSTADYCCDFDIPRITKGDQIRILSEEDRQLFSNPPAGSAGQLAQRRFRGDDVFILDLSLFKSFELPFLGEQGELQLRFEFFNLLNGVDFNLCVSDLFAGICELNINDANFGVISAARDARVGQVGARISF